MARILVVDDSLTQAEALRLMLETDGHHVETAGDAHEAWVRLETPGWDLVITDIVMPGMTGYELCRKIKDHASYRHLPVILLTGLNNPVEILKALEAGADNFLTRPFHPEHLSSRVRDLLEGGRVRGGDAAAVTVSFMGRSFSVSADRTQVFNLLLSTFEDMVATNHQLQDSELALAATRDRLAHYAAALEDRVAKGHALEEELLRKNRELLEQNRKVQEATRMKSDFLAGMSHELRTPLNSIIGFTEILADGVVGPVPPAYQQYLGDILQSSRHLLRLINDVLDLAKVESGKMEIFPETVDLGPILLDTVELVRTQAARKRIRTEVETQSEVGLVTVDPSRLKQILYNYLSNAIKFTPEGGRVVLRVMPADADSYRLEVEDTGVGIQPGDLQRLFVEFQQLQQHDMVRQEGTGLGLALTRRLVEVQGGQVEVKSTPGHGSTFGVVMPRVVRRQEGPTSPMMVRAPLAVAAHIPTGLLDGVPVLVVDGNPLNLKLTELLLRVQGCEVRTARSGVEALATMQTFVPRLVLLDTVLPDVNGHDLVRTLKAAPGSPPKVVALTAAAMKGDLERGLASGFDAYISKPVDPRTLPRQLCDLMAGPAEGGGVLKGRGAAC